MTFNGVQDRYAFDQSLPAIDPQQDWNLTRGENEDGYTTLEFRRKYITCDERDRDIEVSQHTLAAACYIYTVRIWPGTYPPSQRARQLTGCV